MTDYETGYGKPPRSGRFKAGVSGNPRGRPKREPVAAAEVISGVLNAPMKYRERGQTRTATRLEVGLKLLVDGAVAGDLQAADDVLRFRNHALRHGEAGVARLEISDWLPDYAGQTGEQKKKDLSARGVADSADHDIDVNSEKATGTRQSSGPRSA
jgi:hypothetical protein